MRLAPTVAAAGLLLVTAAGCGSNNGNGDSSQTNNVNPGPSVSCPPVSPSQAPREGFANCSGAVPVPFHSAPPGSSNGDNNTSSR